ncbi:hypothetical protein A3F28_01865 [Candidatus Uhrbacteria bacterium RIFCSPHIGHO2_12_FULL_57_11]|uniref:Uncharacterized protein n=2 Tax=Candidatus Uhriibacteriota TaxID=1752732 RepID=A0A1F7UNQ8_9BACT|nr:MAG: hypothetical protein A3D72_02830 [Candidatus Uhrbacteria bacterium RIFCSPHIGHO2_02_FULL_57_19]OGL79394.1 MAG: hypothetical protein A3F28_01865 [Candidatus Uhrbacteria bacterium RIFCSPHIGHO2_12_FULL_57_11]
MLGNSDPPFARGDRACDPRPQSYRDRSRFLKQPELPQSRILHHLERGEGLGAGESRSEDDGKDNRATPLAHQSLIEAVETAGAHAGAEAHPASPMAFAEALVGRPRDSA